MQIFSYIFSETFLFQRRIIRELSMPNFRASVGKIMHASLFRNSGKTTMQFSTSAWLKATIK